MTKGRRRSCVLLVFCYSGPAAAQTLESAGPQTVWRLAEPAAGLPLGAEVELRGDELLAGSRGIGFAADSGMPFHMELVPEYEIEEFLDRRRSGIGIVPITDPEICTRGRFLLNDPRVGLFHNQRISYQTSLKVARALGRILVLPGFFKFPHPDAWDGTQWVRVRRLFNWSKVEECYPEVLELSDLLKLCGPDVLDDHVTVPFETMWMRSQTKAPWIKGTRTHLSWAPETGDGDVVRFESRTSQPVRPIGLGNNFGYVLQPFLALGVAGAQTVRAHGLISNVTTLAGPVCFFPNDGVVATARNLVQMMEKDLIDEPDKSARWLGIHLRLFKRSQNTSGGYLQVELADMQENLCNMGPREFTLIVSNVLARSYGGFVPTHTFLASNEANLNLLLEYLAGFPGSRMNPYTPAHYDRAVSAPHCGEALSAVLVDALICTWAPYFIGNACSTMSEYIYQMRLLHGQPLNSSLLLAGVQHAHLLEDARRIVNDEGPNRWTR